MSEKKILKKFDAEETYAKLVKYYVDKKGYTPERANAIAQKIVQQQMQRRNQL